MSERYRTERQSVEDFLRAWVDLVGLMELGSSNEGGLLTQMRPKRGQNIDPFMAKTALAAGPAGSVAGKYGGLMKIQKTGFSPYETINPILNWSESLRAPWLLPPAAVQTIALNLLGQLRQLEQEALVRERSLAGRVAAVVRFPADVREAVGPGHPGLGRAAFGAGVAVQVLIAAAGGALGTALVAGVVKLVAALV